MAGIRSKLLEPASITTPGREGSHAIGFRLAPVTASRAAITTLLRKHVERLVRDRDLLAATIATTTTNPKEPK